MPGHVFVVQGRIEALVRDAVVVTTDTDFTRVPNLKLLLLDRRSLQPLPRGGGTR